MRWERIKDKTRLLLGKEANDALADFAVDLTCEAICNYCNRADVPQELENTAAAMAVEAYRLGQYGAEQLESQAKSVGRGDTSYTFSTPGEQMQQALASPDFTHNYVKQLNAYRVPR